MCAATQPPTHPQQRPSRIGTAITALILCLGHAITVYVTYVAYMAEPSGPWDREALTHSDAAAVLVLVFALTTALLTWLFVSAQWLRRWWYVLPALLTAAALLRLTLLAPEL